MKKILLFSENMMHYRLSLYDIFSKMYQNIGIEFYVVSEKKIDKEKYNFNHKDCKFSFKKCCAEVNRVDPDYIIVFWNIYNPTTWLLFIWLHFNNRRFVYWSHGISMQNPSSLWRNILYKLAHKLADASILYSPNEIKYLPKNSKAFIAFNTINFNEIPDVNESVEKIKLRNNIPFSKIVLFVGRIQKRKRLEVLIDIFKNPVLPDVGLVIVGPGISKKLINIIEKNKQIIYLGERYTDVNDFFKIADIFCIPGINGLGINQAMYWGLPVLTLQDKHNPEIYYVKNGQTGFIVNNDKDLKDKITELLSDEEKLTKMSNQAKFVIMNEASVDRMFNGFIEAVNYLEKIK